MGDYKEMSAQKRYANNKAQELQALKVKIEPGDALAEQVAAMTITSSQQVAATGNTQPQPSGWKSYLSSWSSAPESTKVDQTANALSLPPLPSQQSLPPLPSQQQRGPVTPVNPIGDQAGEIQRLKQRLQEVEAICAETLAKEAEAMDNNQKLIAAVQQYVKNETEYTEYIRQMHAEYEAMRQTLAQAQAEAQAEAQAHNQTKQELQKCAFALSQRNGNLLSDQLQVDQLQVGQLQVDEPSQPVQVKQEDTQPSTLAKISNGVQSVWNKIAHPKQEDAAAGATPPPAAGAPPPPPPPPAAKVTPPPAAGATPSPADEVTPPSAAGVTPSPADDGRRVTRSQTAAKKPMDLQTELKNKLKKMGGEDADRVVEVPQKESASETPASNPFANMTGLDTAMLKAAAARLASAPVAPPAGLLSQSNVNVEDTTDWEAPGRCEVCGNPIDENNKGHSAGGGKKPKCPNHFSHFQGPDLFKVHRRDPMKLTQCCATK